MIYCQAWTVSFFPEWSFMTCIGWVDTCCQTSLHSRDFRFHFSPIFSPVAKSYHHAWNMQMTKLGMCTMSQINTTWLTSGMSSPNLQWGAVRAGRVHECPTCHIALLTEEKAGFCFEPHGSKFNNVLPLPSLPHEYNAFLNDPCISDPSRILNLVYFFASLDHAALSSGSQRSTSVSPGFRSTLTITRQIFAKHGSPSTMGRYSSANVENCIHFSTSSCESVCSTITKP